MTSDESRELRPVDRYEWTQALRHMRAAGLVEGSDHVGRSGRRTRGGVSAATFKAVALLWASYSDPDGGNIRPGDATVAVDAECGMKTIKAVKATLLALGLTRRVRAGTKATGWADVYQLTLPSDLYESVEMLNPAQHEVAAQRLREQARRKPRTGSAGPGTAPDVRGPVDPVQQPLSADVRGPTDPVEAPPRSTRTGSGEPVIETRTGSAGPDVRGPADPCTNHDQTTKTTNQSRRDLRDDVAVVRARGPSQDPIPECVADPPARYRGVELARRVLAGEVRPDELPDVPDDRQAVVLPFRPRRSA